MLLFQYTVLVKSRLSFVIFYPYPFLIFSSAFSRDLHVNTETGCGWNESRKNQALAHHAWWSARN